MTVYTLLPVLSPHLWF